MLLGFCMASCMVPHKQNLSVEYLEIEIANLDGDSFSMAILITVRCRQELVVSPAVPFDDGDRCSVVSLGLFGQLLMTTKTSRLGRSSQLVPISDQ